jgi:2,4-dienoyl-CoA reductase-like NADH-dependent reductase (Old Yellow Enzyme family)
VNIDALVLSGGFVSKTPLYMLRGKVPLKEMIEVQSNWLHKVGLSLFGKVFVQTYPFDELFFLEKALQVRAAVKMPLVLVGGICTREGLLTAMARGFDLVALGRALIADPDFVRKIEAGEIDATECDHCNECIVEMDRGGVRCVLPDRTSTSR